MGDGGRTVSYTHLIIFIDEIDAVGRQRGAGLGGGHDEREHCLLYTSGRIAAFFLSLQYINILSIG